VAQWLRLRGGADRMVEHALSIFTLLSIYSLQRLSDRARLSLAAVIESNHLQVMKNYWKIVLWTRAVLWIKAVL